jgi:chromosome condensin MukBEF MukE localization factor
MKRQPRLVRSNPPRQQEADVRSGGDFRDPQSRPVLDGAARAVARELGRQAARELWKQAVRR